ncbi:MAG: hypothetical protein JRH10_17295 [Deltaproteobacteria bacterium]|nr:hypothetical protein [Deltaproteobacteria bacterium]MBW2447239.1 hypothetical protein [Deltaproteobacteria bacterium]
MMGRWMTMMALGLGLGLTGAASAGDFDGSKPLLCAPTDIVSCHGAGDCGRMSAEEADMAHFIHLDFEKQTATGKLASGDERVTKFAAPTTIDGAIVIQGIAQDGKRAYSFRVGSDGDLSLAIAGQGGGLMVQGVCTAH